MKQTHTCHCDQKIAEIIRQFEVRPDDTPQQGPRRARRTATDNGPDNGSSTVPNAAPLRARPQRKKTPPAGVSGRRPSNPKEGSS